MTPSPSAGAPHQGRAAAPAQVAAGPDPRIEAHLRADRRYLLGIAYRLLGSVSEAEDALQEAWLRARTADLRDVRDLRAWLAVVTTRVCLDVLKSARATREHYVGEWLPEPLLEDADPADRVTLDDSVNLALMAVLQRLSPAERTAFVLHDVFGYPFDTVARAVGRTPAACRQLASRARAHVRQDAPRFDADAAEHRRAVEAFARAASSGSLDDLLAVLDPDVVLRSDGGGKVRARTAPLRSAPAVAAFLRGIMRTRPGTALTAVPVNGSLGVIATDAGRVSGVIGFAVHAGRITELDLVMNPDKLARVPHPPGG